MLKSFVHRFLSVIYSMGYYVAFTVSMTTPSACRMFNILFSLALMSSWTKRHLKVPICSAAHRGCCGWA